MNISITSMKLEKANIKKSNHQVTGMTEATRRKSKATYFNTAILMINLYNNLFCHVPIKAVGYTKKTLISTTNTVLFALLNVINQ